MKCVLEPADATHLTCTSCDELQAEVTEFANVCPAPDQLMLLATGWVAPAAHIKRAPAFAPAVPVTAKLTRIVVAIDGTAGEQLIVRAAAPNASVPCVDRAGPVSEPWRGSEWSVGTRVQSAGAGSVSDREIWTILDPGADPS